MGKIQRCYMCNSPTERCEEDALTVGPENFCDECYNNLTDNALKMLEALEKALKDNEMPEGTVNCPVCYRRLDISPHKGWCWWGDAVDAVKKARGEE